MPLFGLVAIVFFHYCNTVCKGSFTPRNFTGICSYCGSFVVKLQNACFCEGLRSEEAKRSKGKDNFHIRQASVSAKRYVLFNRAGRSLVNPQSLGSRAWSFDGAVR